MKTITILAFILVTLVGLIGCATSSGPEKVQKGDYATEPGSRPPGG